MILTKRGDIEKKFEKKNVQTKNNLFVVIFLVISVSNLFDVVAPIENLKKKIQYLYINKALL